GGLGVRSEQAAGATPVSDRPRTRRARKRVMRESPHDALARTLVQALIRATRASSARWPRANPWAAREAMRWAARAAPEGARAAVRAYLCGGAGVAVRASSWSD